MSIHRVMNDLNEFLLRSCFVQMSHKIYAMRLLKWRTTGINDSSHLTIFSFSDALISFLENSNLVFSFHLIQLNLHDQFVNNTSQELTFSEIPTSVILLSLLELFSVKWSDFDVICIYFIASLLSRRVKSETLKYSRATCIRKREGAELRKNQI